LEIDGSDFVPCLISVLCIRCIGDLTFFAGGSFELWLGD